jgi:hypothetical protein
MNEVTAKNQWQWCVSLKMVRSGAVATAKARASRKKAAEKKKQAESTYNTFF